ncbi:MAG: hypothetical protein IPL41_01435 [Micropruina sp.]|nr:hypothetical protein [Micropruina sp.]
MDTRVGGQIIVAGTPNVEQRAGLLWDFLQAFLADEPRYGGVVYAAGDRDIFCDMTDPENPVYDVELLKRVHPGLASGLTELEIILSNIRPMGVRKFSCEYLCQWPKSAANRALDIDAWNDCESTTGLPVRPDRIGLAFDVDPDGSSAALVAAWRDGLGRAHFEVLACNGGTDWLPGVCSKAQIKHRAVVHYDSIGQNIEVAERMSRAPYRVKLRPLNMRDNIGAAARFEKEIAARNVCQYGQSDLSDATEVACWRPAGKDGRLFARMASSGSVAPVVASAQALWAYDLASRSEGSSRRVRSAAAILAERANATR